MVIGDQDLDALIPGKCYPLDAGYAIVYCDDQLRMTLGCNFYNLGRQAIAKLKTVGYQVIDALYTHSFQCTHHQSCTCCAIHIKIPNDQDGAGSGNRVT